MLALGNDPKFGPWGCFMVLDMREDPPVPLFTIHRVHRALAEHMALLMLGAIAMAHLGPEQSQGIAMLGLSEGMDAAGAELMKVAPRLVIAALDTRCGCAGADVLETPFKPVALPS